MVCALHNLMKVSKLKLQKQRNTLLVKHNAYDQADCSWGIGAAATQVFPTSSPHTLSLGLHCTRAPLPAFSCPYIHGCTTTMSQTHLDEAGCQTLKASHACLLASTSWAQVIPCSTSAGARPSHPSLSHPAHDTEKKAGRRACLCWPGACGTHNLGWAGDSLQRHPARWAPHLRAARRMAPRSCTLQTHGTPSGGPRRAFRSAARSSRLHGAARGAVQARCSSPGRAAGGSPPRGASRRALQGGGQRLHLERHGAGPAMRGGLPRRACGAALRLRSRRACVARRSAGPTMPRAPHVLGTLARPPHRRAARLSASRCPCLPHGTAGPRWRPRCAARRRAGRAREPVGRTGQARHAAGRPLVAVSPHGARHRPGSRAGRPRRALLLAAERRRHGAHRVLAGRARAQAPDARQAGARGRGRRVHRLPRRVPCRASRSVCLGAGLGGARPLRRRAARAPAHLCAAWQQVCTTRFASLTCVLPKTVTSRSSCAGTES